MTQRERGTAPLGIPGTPGPLPSAPGSRNPAAARAARPSSLVSCCRSALSASTAGWGALAAVTRAVIMPIVRRKLHASLDPADTKQRNLDALDLVSEIRVCVLAELSKQSPARDDGVERGRGPYVEFTMPPGVYAAVALHVAQSILQAIRESALDGEVAVVTSSAA